MELLVLALVILGFVAIAARFAPRSTSGGLPRIVDRSIGMWVVRRATGRPTAPRGAEPGADPGGGGARADTRPIAVASEVRRPTQVADPRPNAAAEPWPTQAADPRVAPVFRPLEPPSVLRSADRPAGTDRGPVPTPPTRFAVSSAARPAEPSPPVAPRAAWSRDPGRAFGESLRFDRPTDRPAGGARPGVGDRPPRFGRFGGRRAAAAATGIPVARPVVTRGTSGRSRAETIELRLAYAGLALVVGVVGLVGVAALTVQVAPREGVLAATGTPDASAGGSAPGGSDGGPVVAPSASAIPSRAASPAPPRTPRPTATPRPAATPRPTPRPTSTAKATPPATAAPSAAPTPTPTAAPTPTPTAAPTPTPTLTPTPEPTPSASG